MKSAVLSMMVEAGMGCNAVCTQCRSVTKITNNALGPWLVCQEQFRANSVLFVGKIARNDSMGQDISDHLEDVTQFGASWIADSPWPYWAYTKAIIERVYGDLATGIPHVSFTNMVKCNNGTLQDTVDDQAKDFCIAKNRFVWKEIELIRPKLVIFYTHTAYDDFISEFMPSYAISHRDNEDTEVFVGQKSMFWWDRSFFDVEGKEVLRLLRVGHPERKNKDDYVRALSDWMIAHGANEGRTRGTTVP